MTRIDRIVAPPGTTIGFLYLTGDGSRFFGTRRRADAPEAAKRYVHTIFLDDGNVSRARVNRILATQNGNAIIYVPNEARLFPALGLARQVCVPSAAPA